MKKEKANLSVVIEVRQTGWKREIKIEWFGGELTSWYDTAT